MPAFMEAEPLSLQADPRTYWLWLAAVLGPGCEHTGELLDVYGSAQEVYRVRAQEDFSPYMPKTACQRLLRSEPEDYQAVLDHCRSRGIAVLTPECEDYPAAFAYLPDLPLVLYCTGKPEVLNGRHTVGIVGSRRPSQYGVEACRTLGGEMARAGAVIVSGLADGLDGEAHRAAVQAGAATVGILGCPIDQTYPAGNRNLRIKMEQNGAVLSEYGPGAHTVGQRYVFLQRNRLIAALSEALCVMEARLKSGTLNTVHHAQRYAKPVYALPGSIFSPLSEGTNHLLAEGIARPLLHAADVLQELGLSPKAAPGPVAKSTACSPDAKTVLALIGPVPKPLETLCEESGLSVGQILAALTELELAGKIIPLAGRRYQLK